MVLNSSVFSWITLIYSCSKVCLQNSWFLLLLPPLPPPPSSSSSYSFSNSSTEFPKVFANCTKFVASLFTYLHNELVCWTSFSFFIWLKYLWILPRVLYSNSLSFSLLFHDVLVLDPALTSLFTYLHNELVCWTSFSFFIWLKYLWILPRVLYSNSYHLVCYFVMSGSWLSSNFLGTPSVSLVVPQDKTDRKSSVKLPTVGSRAPFAWLVQILRTRGGTCWKIINKTKSPPPRYREVHVRTTLGRAGGNVGTIFAWGL